MMAITDEYIKQIKVDFLHQLSELLRTGNMPLENARDICRQFKTYNPFTTFEDLKTKIKAFTQKYTEFGKMYTKILRDEEKYRTSTVLTKMQSLIGTGNIDQALQVAKT